MKTAIMSLTCVILGWIVGSLLPTISYGYSKYVAIAIMAALDSIIGALCASAQKKYDFPIFISGFIVNVLIAIIFTMLGEKLGVDIYLAAIFVFIYRIFNNLSVIRRHFLEKYLNNKR